MTEKAHELMNWFHKHTVELLLSTIIALLLWSTNQVVGIQRDISTLNVKVLHISESVTDVSGQEKTLREIVSQNSLNIQTLLERTRRLYSDGNTQ